MWYSDQVFGPNEELVPAEQQPEQSKCGAALQTGTDYLPLLDRGETALSSACPHWVSALLLVRFTIHSIQVMLIIDTVFVCGINVYFFV